jgi:hypothetical protein
MGVVLDLVDAAIARAAGRREAREKRVPSQAAVAFTDSGRQGKANVKLFRHWSEHSELVRGAIDIRRGQVAIAEWDIVPTDPDKEYSKPLKAQIKRIFDVPNPTLSSFRSFTEPVVEDILVLDAGSIEKVRNLRGQIAQLWYVDGGEVKVAKYWDGEPEEPRFFWYPEGAGRAVSSWLNDNFVYIMSRPGTHRVVGLSTMEVLKLTIDAELGGSAYNARQVTSAAPDGMIDLGEGVRSDQVEKFKTYWMSEIAGKGAMAILGGSRGAKFLPFRQSNRDMQFVEWQNYLLRKVALVFGLSAQDLNSVADINRANAQVLQENTEDRGQRPLLGLVQDYFTREIVWDEGFGGEDNNLSFRFTKLNQKETLDNAKVQNTQTGGLPTRSVNELRKKDGLEPWGNEFDEPMVVAGNQVIRLSDVPSAREHLDASKKPEPVAAGSNSKGED